MMPTRMDVLCLRANARYERRSAACRFAWQYCLAKWEHEPNLTYGISVRWLHEAGFWHRNPRDPRNERIQYEDLVLLECEAMVLAMRLRKRRGLQRT
jgi:hypothetical protein